VLNERRAHRGRAVDQERQSQQRNGYDQRRPDRQGQPTPDPRGTGDDVADAPRQGTEDAQEERRQRHMPAPPDRHDREADTADHRATDLGCGGQLMQPPRSDHDGEDHLGLQHQGRQTGWHAGSHRDVEEAELSQTHEGADSRDRAPRRGWTSEQEDGREDHGDEPDGDEEQRRDAVHAPVDDDEVEAPQCGDDGSEQGVPEVHGSSLSDPIMKHKQLIMPLFR
jgi:hypothetical protein